MHARAILVRSLFAVSWIYSRFVRAITRFQRKFSVNHAKSAYFQRKSRNVSVKRSFSVRLSANLTDNARLSIQKTSWASILRFLSIHFLILKNFYYQLIFLCFRVYNQDTSIPYSLCNRYTGDST